MAIAFLRQVMRKCRFNTRFVALHGILLLCLLATIVTGTEGAASRVLRLEEIRVTGNNRLDDSIILETVRLSAGDTLNVAILGQKRVRLLAEYRLLKEVTFSTRPGSERGLVILDIDVVERSPVSFETGFGYHDTYGWFLTLLGMRVDPALGHGSSFRLGLRMGFNISGLDAELEKYSRSSGFGFGGNLHIYNQRHRYFDTGPESNIEIDDFTGHLELEQEIDRVGGELYFLYRLQDRTRFSLGLRAEKVEPDSSFLDKEKDESHPFEDFPVYLQSEIDQTVITGLFLRFIRDTRDILSYPRSGSFTLIQMQANNRILGGDELFTKVEIDVRKHVGLGGWRVLSSRMRSGITSTGTPYFERFFLGGIYSVRGFRELSLSPIAGHDGYILLSEEFRFPLIHTRGESPRLTGLIFIDAGLGWRRGDPLSLSDTEAAAGYGIRLRLPWLGTFGMDAGIPFTEGRTSDNYRIHASLGFSF